MALIIKNGTLVTATDTYQADLRIANEKVVQIGQDLRAESDSRVLDATDKLVFPAAWTRIPTSRVPLRAPPPPTIT